jgi:hypothetical protein
MNTAYSRMMTMSDNKDQTRDKTTTSLIGAVGNPVAATTRPASAGTDPALAKAKNELSNNIMSSALKHQPPMNKKIQIMKLWSDRNGEMSFDDLYEVGELMGCDVSIEFVRKPQA